MSLPQKRSKVLSTNEKLLDISYIPKAVNKEAFSIPQISVKQNFLKIFESIFLNNN